VRKIVPRAMRAERFFAVWAARGAAQTAKLSQRRTSKKQKVLQGSNPFVSETFVSFGFLAGAPALETDVKNAVITTLLTASKLQITLMETGTLRGLLKSRLKSSVKAPFGRKGLCG
jgi:hypothetical protein